jgi:hypothetical protein
LFLISQVLKQCDDYSFSAFQVLSFFSLESMCLLNGYLLH